MSGSALGKSTTLVSVEKPWQEWKRVRLAAAALAVLLALAVADLAGCGWVNDLGENQIAVTVFAELILLAGAIFVVQAALDP